jgi:hypothetical protein
MRLDAPSAAQITGGFATPTLIVAVGRCAVIYKDSKLQNVPMAPATPTNRQIDKRPTPLQQILEPSLARFVLDPVKGVDSLLRLRRKDAIVGVLAHSEFTSALRNLALKAPQSPAAAVSLARIALRPAFSAAVVPTIVANGEWPDPSKFTAAHRRLAADALERARPAWALPWIGKALLSALAFPDLRRFFMLRLYLAAGGLQGVVLTLTNLLSSHEPKPRGRFDHSTLLEELHNCVRPGVAVPANVFVDFVRAIRPDRRSKGGALLKRQLADLLRIAAAVDRGLLLEQPYLELAASLDADVATALQADADRLSQLSRPLPPATPSHSDLIREAAWSEADEALGRALQDTGRLLRSFERLESVVVGEAADRTRRTKGASDLVLQWVRQAARQRNVQALGNVGDRVPYDPAFHDLDAEASMGDPVRIVKPPIVRGTGAQQVVLLRGEVDLD